MKKRYKIVFGAMIVVLVGASLGYGIYREATWVDEDLSELASFAETESYAALIARIGELPPEAEGFTFVALGDTRSFYTRALRVLNRAVAENPAFILSNGDIIRAGTVDEYINHHLKLTRATGGTPFIPAPGNHEKGPNRDFAGFKALYGGLRFSFDYGGARFVGVNNGDFNKMSRGDLKYLDTELSKPGADHKFVVFHVPPAFLEQAVESEGSRGFSWNAKKFQRLMEKHEVDHVFAGHVHGFATEVINGVRYTITGGGGANLTDKLGDEGKFHHFILVHVGPDGVESEIVKYVDREWLRESIE